jgi:hypothetical protein
MIRYNLVPILYEEDIPATIINERFAETFGLPVISYLTVTRIIKYVIWKTLKGESKCSRKRPPNLQHEV